MREEFFAPTALSSLQLRRLAERAGKGFSIYVRCKDNEKVTRKVKKARNFFCERGEIGEDRAVEAAGTYGYKEEPFLL